jgi:hypothetical protein
VITIEAGFLDSACGGAVVQLATTPGNEEDDAVVVCAVRESVGLAAAVTVAGLVPAALVSCALHAETVARASPASAQAANVVCSEREVFMPSTTDKVRRWL